MSTNTLPPVDQEFEEAYKILVRDIDTLVAEIINKHIRKPIVCRPGCDDCCIAFSVLALEASLISSELSAKGTVSLHKDRCKLLKNKRCTIYEFRPIICRTQGVPIGYINEESGVIEVSACPVNFPSDYEFHHEELLFMDKLNERLSKINNDYCERKGLDPLKRIELNSL